MKDTDPRPEKSNLNEDMTPALVASERAAIVRHGRFYYVHWLFIIMSILLTFAIWQYTKTQVENRTQFRFEQNAAQVTDLITERLQKYELALWAGVAAIKLNEDQISLPEWQEFSENLEIEHRYPGINGIGVIFQVKPEDMDSYLAEQRDLRPDFKVYPPHDGDIFLPITYIEPVDINKEAVGLDMMHEENRLTSIRFARDTGQTQITGPIVLVQDHDNTPGFLFFAPFFKGDRKATEAERRANFIGAVYAPFIVHKLMDGVLDRDRRTTAIRISDGEGVIYDEFDATDPDFDPSPLGQMRLTLPVYGREWSVDVRTGLSFRAQNSGIESTVILVLGIIIDVGVLVMFLLLTKAYRRGLRFTDIATAAINTEARALSVANQQLDQARAEAESASATKSTFLATMSHEIRTPLTAISGILVLLERAKLPSEQQKLVQAGKVASEKLIKLLTDVLDVSRLEANAVELWERRIALRPLIEEWEILARGMIEKLRKDIRFYTVIDPSTPDTILVDDIRLSQVMNNLLDNAIRFTESGSIQIETRREPGTDGAPDQFVLALIDTGTGIAQRDIEHVFDRFQQVDGSMTRTQGGSGLGLAICHDLMELMNGEISVSSALGSGTKFELKLPIRDEDPRG